MPQALKVVVASKSVDQRVAIKKALLQTPEMEITGEGASGADLLRLVKEHNPDIVLIDHDLEGDVDGLGAAEEVSFRHPGGDIILLSKASDELTHRKAMLAGVRQVMPKPFQPDDLLEVVKLVGDYNQKKKRAISEMLGIKEDMVHNSKTFTVFSTKGGVGRSLISLNLAVALKKMTGKKVALVDMDLQFGDVAVMMRLKPRNVISGLAREIEQLGDLDDELVKGYMTNHEPSGVDVLCAPLRPEEAEAVSAAYAGRILKKLSEHYHYVVVDTPSYLSDTVLTSLELSDNVLLILTMELPTLKDGKLMLEIMNSFGYSVQEKVKVILNREDAHAPFKIKDVEETIGVPVTASVPSDGGAAMPAVNEGEPVVIKSPDAKISKAIESIVKALIPAEEIQATAAEKTDAKKKKK